METIDQNDILSVNWVVYIALAFRGTVQIMSFVYFSSLLVYIFEHLLGNDVAKPGGGWQRGEGGGRGHDPVSRTNFNKIHASPTVLTKFDST